MTERFVITGSGRCGTLWMSHALTAAGVPCGHERVFNGTGISEWEEGVRADSSWMAATRFDQIDMPVVLLVRHPLAVVKSWVEIGFFGWDIDNPTHGPLYAAYPWIYDRPSPQDRALDMWLSLTSATLARAELVLKIEQMTDRSRFDRLLGWCGADPDAASEVIGDQDLARNLHDESREKTGLTHVSTWLAHDAALARRAQRLASMLGYRGI